MIADFESMLDESGSEIHAINRHDDLTKTTLPIVPDNEELKIKTEKTLNKMSMMATTTKPLQEREDKPVIVINNTITCGSIPMRGIKQSTTTLAAGADIAHLKSMSKKRKENEETIVFWCEKPLI